MKIKYSIFFLTIVLSTQAFGRKMPFGRAGCGLGSVIFGPSGNQSSASTTNGSASNQFFGITSGTSGCKADGSKWATIEDQYDFVVNNLRTLSKEMAQAEGKSLQALSQAFGCPNSLLPQFKSHLQGSFNVIFAEPGAEGVLWATIEELMKKSDFANKCQKLYLVEEEVV